MASPARIRTPLKQHLHRFRLSALPLIAFVLSVLVTLWLWQRQATQGTMVGEVEAIKAEVPSAAAGTLISPDSDYWQLFEPVKKGQVLAQLDDKHLKAQLVAIEARAAQLGKELEAAAAKLKLDQLDLDTQNRREKLQLSWELERLRLAEVEQQASVEVLKTEGRSLKTRYLALQTLQEETGLANQTELATRRDAYQLALSRFLEGEKVLKEIVAQRKEIEQALQGYQEVTFPDIVNQVLDPIQANIAVQQEEMRRVTLMLEDLVITAPMDGVIIAIHARPNQHVQPGASIMTIASPDSSYVISYVRDRRSMSVYEGMEVALRLNSEPAQEYVSQVETVGPQVQPVPAQQLGDQTIPEWATPVKIPIPPELQQRNLRPGQLVQVIFKTTRNVD